MEVIMKKIAITALIVISFCQSNFARRVTPSSEEARQANEKRLLFEKALDNKIQDLKEGVADLESINIASTYFSADDYQNMINLLKCDCKEERKELKDYSSRMY